MNMPFAGATLMTALMLANTHSIPVARQDKPNPLTPQQSFEAGQYDDAMKSIGELRAKGGGGLPDAFLAAQIALKQTQNDRAKEEFSRLTASGDAVWKLVGESGIAAVENDKDKAADLGLKAVDATKPAEGKSEDQDDPGRKLRNFYAFYQLGLARTRKEDWTGAAESFAKAVELNPNFAYAHYYAGLSYSRIKRPDQVAKYFEAFLKLAPKAPERSAVQSMLKAIRGD